MSLSLSRKTKLITKWTNDSTSGLTDSTYFASDSGTGYDTSVLTLTSGLPSFTPNYTTIDRTILKDSFYATPPIRGYAEISASLSFELTGAEGTNYKPTYHPFFYGALGSVLTVSTTIDTSTNTPSFTASGDYYTGDVWVDDVTGLKVGYFVRIYASSATRVIGEITAIDSSAKKLTLRIHSNMSTSSSTPTLGITDGDSVTTGVIYSPSDSTDLPNLYFDVYRQTAGASTYIKETYGEMTVSELAIPITSGQIVIPTVNLDGSSVSVSSGASAPSNSDYDIFPIVARKNAIWLNIGGTIKDAVASANFTITNTIYKKFVVGGDGATETSRTQRQASATMNLYYEDNTLIDALVNDTSFEISSVLPTHYPAGGNATIGDAVTIKVPQAKLLNTPVSDDNGVYKEDLTVSIELPDNPASNEIDKELVIQVL